MEERKQLLKVYNEDKNPRNGTVLPEDGEPGFHFHEFIFLLGLIAVHNMESSPSTPPTTSE